MVELQKGNILDAGTEALVNTVNTAGVMGKGLALQFRRAFPDNYQFYRSACQRNEVQPGRMLIFPTNRFENPHYIVNFPTKRHWKARSTLQDIDAGLVALVGEIRRFDFGSIAIPSLGCGNGGLDWNVVRPRILKALTELPDVRVLLYQPWEIPPDESLYRRGDPTSP